MARLISIAALALLLSTQAPALAGEAERGECLVFATAERCVTEMAALAVLDGRAMTVQAHGAEGPTVDEMRSMTISMGAMAGFMLAIMPLTATAIVGAIVGGVASAVVYDYTRELR